MTKISVVLLVTTTHTCTRSKCTLVECYNTVYKYRFISTQLADHTARNLLCEAWLTMNDDDGYNDGRTPWSVGHICLETYVKKIQNNCNELYIYKLIDP